MNARDDLAKAVFVSDNGRLDQADAESEWEDARGPNEPRYAYGIADGLLAAGYSKPRTISTVEELEELPAASILIAGSRIYQKERGALMDLGIGLLGYEEALEESGRLTLIHTPKES